MSPVKIMVNGLPGNVSKNIAEMISTHRGIELVPYSLTGSDIEESGIGIGDIVVKLIKPEARNTVIDNIILSEGPFISVDYTHPSAVNGNAEFYSRKKLHFIMGTTGGDRKQLFKTVSDSEICAVIAPNMAKQIVGVQAVVEYAAKTFPDLFKDYTLEISESHQAGKADTSGTAKAMAGYLKKLGPDFNENQIQKERDPEIQKNIWKIPEKYINGHGWHTYTLTSKDKTAKFSFTHNICGRDIYTEGTLDAVNFLNSKIKSGIKGHVFTMVDVLKR